jgi:hypothetical protein
MSDVGHRIRAACTICDRSHLAQVAKERVSPDPAVRAEAADADAEEWKDGPLAAAIRRYVSRVRVYDAA